MEGEKTLSTKGGTEDCYTSPEGYWVDRYVVENVEDHLEILYGWSLSFHNYTLILSVSYPSS